MSIYCIPGECNPKDGHARKCSRFEWDDERARARYPNDPQNPDKKSENNYQQPMLALAGGTAVRNISNSRPSILGFSIVIPGETLATCEVEAIFPFEAESFQLCTNGDWLELERITVGDKDQIPSVVPLECFNSHEPIELGWDRAEKGDKIILHVRNVSPEKKPFRAIVRGKRF